MLTQRHDSQDRRTSTLSTNSHENKLQDPDDSASDPIHCSSTHAPPASEHHGSSPDEPIDLDAEDSPSEESDIKPLPAVDNKPFAIEPNQEQNTNMGKPDHDPGWPFGRQRLEQGGESVMADLVAFVEQWQTRYGLSDTRVATTLLALVAESFTRRFGEGSKGGK